jgi:hypothetical protein
MGINLVVGYSAYDENFEPLPDAIDYSENPVYFDFGANMDVYDRLAVFANRGQVVTPSGDGLPATYDGNVLVLVEDPALEDTWVETVVPIASTIFGTADYPAGEPFLDSDITGFTRMTDDNLRVIEFIHTYQIPALR